MTAAAPTAAGCATAISDAAALAEASLVKGRNHVIDGAIRKAQGVRGVVRVVGENAGTIDGHFTVRANQVGQDRKISVLSKHTVVSFGVCCTDGRSFDPSDRRRRCCR